MTETYGYDKTPTPPRDYDASKVPTEIKKRSTWVKTKFTGEDVAEAYAQGMEITGIYSDEAKQIAQQTKVRQDNLETQTAQSVAQMEADKNTIVANATVDSEVILARGGKPTLQARLDETTAQLAQTVTYTELDAQLATLLDGGPSIFMDSLAMLQSTYPNGAAGVALVRETDPAKIYVWDGSMWKDFGDYQGMDIGDGVVNYNKLNTFLKESLYPERDHTISWKLGTININTGEVSNSTIRIINTHRVFMKKDTVVSIVKDGYSFIIVLFETQTGATRIASSGSEWLKEYTFRQDAYVTLALKKDDDSDLSNFIRHNDLIDFINWSGYEATTIKSYIDTKKVDDNSVTSSAITSGAVTKDKLGHAGLSEKWQTSTTVDDYSVDEGVIAIKRNPMSGVWNGVWTTPSDNYTFTNLFGGMIIGYSDTKFLAFSPLNGDIQILNRYDWNHTILNVTWSPVTPITRGKEIKIDISGNIVTVFNADGSLYASLDLSTIEELESELPNFHIGVVGNSWWENPAYPAGTKLFKISTTSDDDLFTSFYDKDIEALENRYDKDIEALENRYDQDIGTLGNRIDALTSLGSGESSVSHWAGKTWHAFGTSMTSVQQGKYVPVVTDLSGMVTTNHGIPGGRITGNIYNAILNVPQNVDLVTLEAGPNNFSTPLGEFGDRTNATFYGALDMCFKHLTKNTTARVVGITIHPSRYSHLNPSVLYDGYQQNEFGDYWRDYAKAIKEVAEVYSVPVIDGYAESGLGATRLTSDTLLDHIHQSALGGKIFGEYVWSKLKHITPNRNTL